MSEAESTTTRQRILKAARKTLEERGSGASMTEIARAAGVSRQTLYLQFGDRTGLLRTLLQSAPQRELVNDSGIRAMGTALERRLPPLEVFELYFRGWIRLLIRIEPIYRPYWRQAEGDVDLMAALKDADMGAYRTYHAIFEKLHAAKLLRPIWTAEEAADAAYQTTMYGIFVGHLRNMRGWTPEEIEERGMKVLRATFLTDAAARKAAKIKV